MLICSFCNGGFCGNCTLPQCQGDHAASCVQCANCGSCGATSAWGFCITCLRNAD